MLIKILIADDHTVVRNGLRFLIENNETFELIGEAANGEQAVKLAEGLKPDVILMDLVMSPMNGIEAIQRIRETDAQARILVLTSFTDDYKVFPAIKAGAMGYLLKDSSPEQLTQAIIDVYNGEPSLHPRIAIKVMRELKNPSTQLPLTDREMDVLKLIAQGLTNQQISERLFISIMTVGTHVRNILGKLHLANRTQAALYALRKGLADLE